MKESLCVCACVREREIETESYHVSSQVNAEDGYSAQRQRDTSNNEEEKGRDLRDVAGKSVGY